MKKYTSLNVLFFLISLYTCFAQNSSDKQLFQIIENGKIGFINAEGEMIIKPLFLSAGEFSEGLAPARIAGTYGYIDTKGSFVIKPQFDYATEFREGLAKVYLNEKPFFISKHGIKAFDSVYKEYELFKNGRSLVSTYTDKYGFIDTKGNLIIDTAFAMIQEFKNGIAVVKGLHHRPYEDRERGLKENFEMGVIDSLGQFIIPYGTFSEIHNYQNGYLLAKILHEPWDTIGGYTAKTPILDRTGEMIISKDHKNRSYIYGNLYCGMAKMYFYKFRESEENGVKSTSTRIYMGYMNKKGEIAINDTNYTSVENFSDNRAFVRNDDYLYSIIDTEGKVIVNKAFNRILGSGFINGKAFVKVDSEWGLIDTNANFIIKPRFDRIDDVGIMDNYFFFQQYVRDSVRSGRFYGVASEDGNILVKPVMDDFDRNGFQGGLLWCIINHKISYVNRVGDIVWQQAEDKIKQVENLNIDFMKRGYFYAYSKPDKNDLGGFASNNNGPSKNKKTKNFTPGVLSVSVRTDHRETIDNRYQGIPVFVANATKKKLYFDAQDSRLYMKVQALNNNGEWRDIEYLPSSWCGNSYHKLSLKPGKYWKFKMPVYEGDFNTKLRVELEYCDPDDKSKDNWERKTLKIYNNEFDGSINPGQFWRKQDYTPAGIMDPYND